MNYITIHVRHAYILYKYLYSVHCNYYDDKLAKCVTAAAAAAAAAADTRMSNKKTSGVITLFGTITSTVYA